MLHELGGGETGFGGTSFGLGKKDLADFLRECVDGEDPAKVNPGFVPMSVFWVMDEANQLVGIVRMRHRLNEQLLQRGGHLGYYIRPSARGRGYAKRALGLGLQRLRELGVARVLVTVDPDNAASIRVILANGGLPDTPGRHPENGNPVNRYWFDLGA
jgi:predicted acetyltransferase